MSATEVWFRNPDNYIRELVECEVGMVAWDRGFLVKKSLDPHKHAGLYFGRAIPWRALVIGEQGSAEIGPDNDMTKPVAVYPTWRYGEDATLLEDMVENPAGNSMVHCTDLSVGPDERPVYGQEHRVVISDVPNASAGPGRKFLRYLKELQEDNPDCIIHVHGLYSFRMAFGLGFRAADVEPRTAAQKGKLHLPSGKEELYERAQANPQWVTALGFKPVDLAVPRNRCMYNIKSALWAGKHYAELYKFKTQGDVDVSPSTPDADFTPATTRSHMSVPKKKQPGDGFACDTCSLQNECKYQRAGAVCSVPGAEPTPLAKFFKSRDSDTIIDGLGTLMAAQTRRLERGMADEDDFGLDPEVTKMMSQLFEQGVKLAKLVNPDLRGGAKVNVNVNGTNGGVQVAMGDPRQMVKGVIRELEMQGIPRDKITPAMIQGVMEGMVDQGRQRQAIEGTVIEHEGS
jgi:hypothetical protein